MTVPEGQSFLQTPRVRQIRTTLRVIWAAMVVSMGWVTYVLHHALTTSPIQPQWIGAVAVVFAVLSFVVPDWIQRNMRPPPNVDSMDSRLGMLLITHILRFAFTEAALLIVLLSNAESLIVVGCAYGAALGLMFFHFPSDTRIAAAE